MATRYSQVFTLKDIFNNPILDGKIPLINYKEIQKDDGKMSYRTYGKTITKQVFDIAKASARPHYTHFSAKKLSNLIEIDGTIATTLESAYRAILSGLNANKTLFKFIGENADVIRSALKEAEKNKRVYGFSSKLHLRVQSMEEIHGMSNQQLIGMMNNIMEDIYFSGNYPKTVKKYGIEELLNSQGAYNFAQRQRNWQIRVGE